MKHRGELLSEVAQDDPNYLRWLYREMANTTDLEHALEEALTEAGEDLE